MTTNQIVMPDNLDVESLPDFEAVKRRFEENFEDFIYSKKIASAVNAVQEELGELPLAHLAHNKDFVGRVAAAIEDDSLTEKRFVFISVNPHYFESLKP